MNSYSLIKTLIVLFIFLVLGSGAASAVSDLAGIEFWLWIYAVPNWIQAAVVISLGMALAWLGFGLYRLLNRLKVGKLSLRSGLYTSLAGALVGILVIMLGAGPWEDLVVKKISGLPPTAAGPPEIERAYQLTNALMGLSQAYQQASGAAKTKALDDLLAAASERYDLLTGLVESDPRTLLDVALSEEELAKIPPQAESVLEKHRKQKGKLQVFYEDYAEYGQRRHVLQADGEELSLKFADETPETLSDAEVSVAGVQVGAALVLEANGDTTSYEVTAPGIAMVAGDQKTLVFALNFSDTALACSPSEIDSMMFTDPTLKSVSDFYLETSF